MPCCAWRSCAVAVAFRAADARAGQQRQLHREPDLEAAVVAVPHVVERVLLVLHVAREGERRLQLACRDRPRQTGALALRGQRQHVGPLRQSGQQVGLRRHGRLLIQRTRQHQRPVVVQRQDGAQRLHRRVGGAPGADQHGARVRQFDFRAQHVEPRGRAGLEAHLGQAQLRLRPAHAFFGDRNPPLLQERAVVRLHDLQRQRLARAPQLLLRRVRLRRLWRPRAFCSRPPV